MFKMKTKEEQRNLIREKAKAIGESVSIPTKKNKSYIKTGKKKSRRASYLKGIKSTYG